MIALCVPKGTEIEPINRSDKVLLNWKKNLLSN